VCARRAHDDMRFGSPVLCQRGISGQRFFESLRD
jgi:hypothetical protein